MNIFRDQNELTEALKTCKKSFRSLMTFSAAVNILALTPSIYMLQVYDRVLASSNEATLAMLTLIAVGLFVLAGLLEASRTFILVRVGNKLDVALNQRVYNCAYEVQLRTGASGNAGQSLRDLTVVRQFLTGNGIMAFFDTPWIPIYMGVMFLFHPGLGLLAVVGALISITLTFANNKQTDPPLTEANRLAIKSAATADSNLRNAEVIEAMGMLGALRNRWLEEHFKFLALQAQASDKAAVWTHASKYFRIFLQSAALGLGAYYVIEQTMTPGMMIAASILMGRALAPIDQLIGVWKSYNSTKQAYMRLIKLMENAPAAPEGLKLPDPAPNLSFESVTAGPPGSRQFTVRNLSVAIKAGQVVGVIGPSGAGKSTLARLAIGIWKPQNGIIRLDGADINQYSREHIGPFIGYLPQEVELFAGTVSENIARFGELDSQKIVAAAQAAGVHQMILNLPKGYDTPLGERGAGLSGGQKQRLGLARAMYGNPKLLVLDEPNSNLDDAGEQALINALTTQREAGHTVIVITHKTSVLTVTDSLILMRDGTIAAAGPSGEVLKVITQQQAPQKNTAAIASAGNNPIQVVNTNR
ncbi:type I secretion system permease/ATPase [Limnobacter parvus]|uniref:Type I secretion system permease/ATPase n=1 Tax=Limnobacter parvus TaxID=2939690 RepID=A0ABT1XD84_9BURK|nr:type I secretion system permease/ATPase [Limnobacter parvus]MCR2745235.1 type I secretion system permease/ATPase [Limnobacter parvus]